LGVIHLHEATRAVETASRRSAYSRAYYAAYNASKAVRYLASGFVSLKGDDHSKAAELPDDFPEVDRWANEITQLYAHRLRADYDNWDTTEAAQTLTPERCRDIAAAFVEAARIFIASKFGVRV
jgi:isoleucyl-tRNA synthetase